MKPEIIQVELNLKVQLSAHLLPQAKGVIIIASFDHFKLAGRGNNREEATKDLAKQLERFIHESVRSL